MSPFPDRPQLLPLTQVRNSPLYLQPQFWFTPEQHLEYDERKRIALLHVSSANKSVAGRKPLFGRHR